MRPDTITLAIEEHYTPEEKAEIAQQMAAQIADRETIKLEKSESDAVFNGRLKACDTQISDLAKKYNKGCETAQIGCDIKYDNPEPGKKSYYRMDRGELVNTYEMSWEEKQETLQFPLSTSTEAPTESSEESGEISATFGPSEHEAVKQLMEEMQTKCDHLLVSKVGETWKCDACEKVLDGTPLATPDAPFEIGQQTPPEDFDQSDKTDGASA